MAGDLIHWDIRRARTLPSEWYADEDLHGHIVKMIGDSIQFAVHDSEIVSNHVIPLDHLVGDPLLVTRDDTGTRCISNVCTHRGMLVATERCSVKRLQCAYHGRTFSLDGNMVHMPCFEDVEGFPSPGDNLQKVGLHSWHGFRFCGDEHFSFDELDERLGHLSWDGLIHDPSRNREFDVAANWALYVDNYLEGFHVPYVHPGLNQELDYSQYRTELLSNGVLQVGIANEGGLAFEQVEGSPDDGESVAAYYLWLFPNTMLNIYPWGVSVNIVKPVTVNSCKVIYRGYVADGSNPPSGAGGDLDSVEMEDQGIVEKVQIGIQSSMYDRGRYSPEMEMGVHHFHRLLTSFIMDGAEGRI